MTGPLAGYANGIVDALIARGLELETQAAEAVARQQEAWRRKAVEQARNNLVEGLKDRLGITIGPDEVTIEPEDAEGQRAGSSVRSVVDIEGYRFSHGFSTQHVRNSGTFGLQIERPCDKGCGKPLWVQITGYKDVGVQDLARLVSEPQHHQWGCLQQFDEDGEATTDEQGRPLPPPKPRVPTDAERYQQATDVYSNLVKLRRELQFQKAIEKEEATVRVLASGVAKSATAAEKLVGIDKQYAALCRTLTETIVSEIRAKETMIAARPHSQHEPVGGPEDAP